MVLSLTKIGGLYPLRVGEFVSSIYDFGFEYDMPVGWASEGWLNKKCYSVWRGMAKRCYIPTTAGFKNYGGKGVYVCEEWKKLSKFSEWYITNYVSDGHLDKDISGVVDEQGFKYYSPKSCVIVTPRENAHEMMVRNESMKEMYYYETKSLRRETFKTRCSTRGWIFGDFEEIWLGEKTENHSKLFVYFHKDSISQRPKPRRYSQKAEHFSEWENVAIRRSSFVRSCKLKGLNRDDFIEVWLGEYGKRGEKMFLYFHKDTCSDVPKSVEYFTTQTKIYSFERKPIARRDFKRSCERHGFNYNDYYEMLSELRKGGNALYYYVHYLRAEENL